MSSNDGDQMLDLVNETIQKQKTLLPGNVIILIHDRETTHSTFRRNFEMFINEVRANGRFNLITSARLAARPVKKLSLLLLFFST
jgi:hypothetical protein